MLANNCLRMFDYFQRNLIECLGCICRRRPNEDRVKVLMDKHRCPENIPNMTIPKTNTEVWDLLPRGYQVADNGTQ